MPRITSKAQYTTEPPEDKDDFMQEGERVPIGYEPEDKKDITQEGERVPVVETDIQPIVTPSRRIQELEREQLPIVPSPTLEPPTVISDTTISPATTPTPVPTPMGVDTTITPGSGLLGKDLEQVAAEATLDDFVQVSENEWHITKPNGETARIIITPDEIIVYSGNPLEPEMHYARGSYKYDAQMAQLNAIKDGFYRSLEWWEEQVQWWHSYFEGGELADDVDSTQREVLEQLIKYSPHSYTEPPVLTEPTVADTTEPPSPYDEKEQAAMEAAIKDFNQVSDNEWEITRPNGETARVVITDTEIIVYGGNPLVPEMHLPKGTYKYDALIAQLAAIKDGFYRPIEWWEEQTQWAYFFDPEKANKTQQEVLDLLDKYSPKTWVKPDVPTPDAGAGVVDDDQYPTLDEPVIPEAGEPTVVPPTTTPSDEDIYDAESQGITLPVDNVPRPEDLKIGSTFLNGRVTDISRGIIQVDIMVTGGVIS